MVKMTYKNVVEISFSDKFTVSIAKVDIVVNAPSKPVPNNSKLSWLISASAAIAPNINPRISEPSKFTVIVPYGNSSEGIISEIIYLSIAPMAPPIPTSSISLPSITWLGHTSFDAFASNREIEA